MVLDQGSGGLGRKNSDWVYYTLGRLNWIDLLLVWMLHVRERKELRIDPVFLGILDGIYVY